MRRALATASIAVAAAAAAGPAAATVRVAADPGLYPHFQRGAHDYVSRCVPGKPLTLTISATDGEKAAVGHDDPRGGTFVKHVRRGTGQAVTIHVESPTRPGAFHVRCLPPDFPRWTASRPGKPQARFYIVDPNGNTRQGYLAIVDSRATPIWWRHSSTYGPWDGKLIAGHDIAWTHYRGGPFGQEKAFGYEQHHLDGRTVRHISAVGAPSDTHDLQRLSDGHYLIDSYVPRHGVDLRRFGGPRDATVYDGRIQEVTRRGKVVWSWSSRRHIKLAETGRWYQYLNHDQYRKKKASERFWDLVHLNSVQPDGKGLIVSFRHLDAVFRISRETGKVLWKLGGTKRKESLTVLGDPQASRSFGPLAGQHDARLYSDGTLTAYDNETNVDGPPRAVRYRIDTHARTATLLEQIRPPDLGLRSGFAGSARKLAGGNWVIYWGGTELVTEQQPSGATALSIEYEKDHWGYRAFPVAGGDLDAATLRHAMDRMAAHDAMAAWR